MNGRWDTQRGFTLLELLMVVIIIAILASIALPQYFRVVERSRIAQVASLLSTIRGSEIRFKAQNPANLYTVDLAVGTSPLDVQGPANPLPVLPPAWVAGSLTVTGTAAGSNVTATRAAAAITGGALLTLDLDSGTLCASTVAAQAEWGVGAPGC